MELFEKTVVITGGGSGIGAATARAMAAAGARVVVADRDMAGAEAVAAGIGGLAVACDVTQEAEIQSLIDRTQDTLGPIDLFYSNAGLGRGDPDHAASAPDAMWMLNWNVHVMAHVWACRALLPSMIDRGQGYLMSMASAAGLLNQIGDAAYSATKHAAVSFAESLAITHADQGIRVSVVCPQYVATPLLGMDDSDADQSDALLTADDVAQAIVKGVASEQFLILPHPQVKGYSTLRASDPDRWLTGMRMLRAKALREFGRISPEDLYKLM